MTDTSPTPEKQPAPLRRLSARSGLAAGFGIGALLVLGFVMLAGRSQAGPLAALWSAITGRNTRIVSQSTVVERVQRLQRLETVVYNMDKIVTGEKDSPILPDFLAGDRLLMLVHGQVVAGVDFSRLNAADIQIHGKQVRLRLPAPQVLMTRVDNARTRVYSRNTGLLVPVDPNLETRVRQEAERQLLQDALTGGILNNARQNARSTVTSLLSGLGFENIEVE